MTKISSIKLSQSAKNNLIKQFWFALSEINQVEKVEYFFQKLLTPTEILMLSKRLDILKQLNRKNSYENIKSTLKVTDATISRLSNLIHEDPTFLNVIENLSKKERDRLEKETHFREHPGKPSKKVWP